MSNIEFQKQFELFDALSEAQLYHSEPDRPGFFSMLYRNSDGSGKKYQRSYRISEMAQVLSLTDYSRDTWISQAEFVCPRRRVVNLARIGVLFVDLDTYKTTHRIKDMSLDAQVQTIHFWCAEAGIPPPSLIIFSGRGLQAKWLLRGTIPRGALPRWNACQKILGESLKELGADKAARDASRVFRLVESVHSISGETVRVVDVLGSPSSPVLYDFDELADRLLPMTRHEYQELKARREIRDARRKLKLIENPRTEAVAARFKSFNGRSLAWHRCEDLRTLGEIRGGWVDKDSGTSARTQALHWQLNFLALSGAVNGATFHLEARELAKQIDPSWSFSDDELITLRAKAIQYGRGEKIEFNGRKWPALYTPKNQTLIDLFEITELEQRQLKTIISKDEATRRNTERERARRRAAGALERAEYISNAKARKEQIRALKGEGVAVAEIARRLGVSRQNVYDGLKES
ncbi:replication protein [Stutzerimonas zhaodongensis]|uniref:replication protein n=1 Tax=Stutzerimonas zhaodongensis TaxID=1176257 RepID=UPI00210541B9|nr:replication protein [Stutzerimonas zhaodongensis]MCQ2032240.1 replication protein [Stutzerimonas zhaodongensis]